MQRRSSDTTSRTRSSRTRSSRTRKLAASAAISITAAVGVGALLPASPASAAALPMYNASTQLGAYPVPATEPNSSTPVLPQVDGAVGRPTQIAMTGNAEITKPQALGVMRYAGSSNSHVMTLNATVSASTTWHFQRIGFTAVANPSTDPQASLRLATPVYRIINYAYGGPECLTAQAVVPPATPVIDAPVTASTCVAPGDPGDTSQLWLVGSPGLKNAIFDISTGTFTPSSASQYYSPALQRTFVGATPDYQHSVIENFDSLTVNSTNNDVTQTPVLSAEIFQPNGQGSTAGLHGQTEPSTDIDNSTWDLRAGG
jgi:hypothetical protein